jgi:hypothetical protein
MRSMLSILVVGMIMGPLASLQYGNSGWIVVAIGAATMCVSMWLSAWCTLRFTQNDTAMGLFAGTAVRMLLPLAMILAVVMFGRPYVEPRSVLYIVPLYFAMVVADAVSAVHRLKTRPSGTTVGSTLHSTQKFK